MSRARANADATSQTYIENNASTQDLSGTYSTERLYFNDSYQLTGDVTVTGHLALGSIADEDVVITQDSTERTITGAGTLESGRLMNDVPSLTGMTGELGSAVTGTLGSGVTGGSGLTALGTVTAGNLSNTAIVYPAGHVTNIFSFSKADETGYSAYTHTDTATTVSQTALSWSAISGRKYHIFSSMGHWPYINVAGNTTAYGDIKLWWGVTARAQGLTQTGDNLLTTGRVGRTEGSSTSPANSYFKTTLQGTFTAASTATHYVYQTGLSIHSTVVFRAMATSAAPWDVIIFETMP